MPTLEQQGYQLLTTEEMLRLLEAGHKLTLPRVDIDDEFIREHYTDEELSHLGLEGDMNDIISIEYIGEQPVMCIAVDDPEHMYLTDWFIPTHNTSNIVFLKSTDDSMLETLEKMSGKTHKVYKSSKSINRHIDQTFSRNDGTISYTMSVVEEPVIKYNDMAFISERNSIVFRAGDSPIWNRDMTILPMSWRLFKTTIVQPGTEYSLQTIPTTSTARDFDVRKNMPDFHRMLNKRIDQACVAKVAMDNFQAAYGYSDYQLSTLDPDMYANEVMDIINAILHPPKVEEGEHDPADGPEMSEEERIAMLESEFEFGYEDHAAEAEDNPEMIAEIQKSQQLAQEWSRPRYAGNHISRENLVTLAGQATHSFDLQICEVFKRCKGKMQHDTRMFTWKNGIGLFNYEGDTCFIACGRESEALRYLNEQAQDENSRVFAEEELEEAQMMGTYRVTDAFYKFLVSLDSWGMIADGAFEEEMRNQVT